MRTWTLKVPELSKARVEELQRFCWQYREKKARIAAMRGATGGSGIDGMPHGQGGIGRPTEQTALRIIDSRDMHDVQIIEECAREAAAGCEGLYQCLVANVCDRVAVKSLPIPQGVNQYTATRKRFFWLLDKKR